MNYKELKCLDHHQLKKMMFFQEINYNRFKIIKIYLNQLERLFMEHKEFIYFLDIFMLYIKELNWLIKFVRILNKMKNLKVKLLNNFIELAEKEKKKIIDIRYKLFKHALLY